MYSLFRKRKSQGSDPGALVSKKAKIEEDVSTDKDKAALKVFNRCFYRLHLYFYRNKLNFLLKLKMKLTTN